MKAYEVVGGAAGVNRYYRAKSAAVKEAEAIAEGAGSGDGGRDATISEVTLASPTAALLLAVLNGGEILLTQRRELMTFKGRRAPVAI